MSEPTNITELRDHVYQLMDQLGDGADQVADRMRALGIRGERGSDNTCPLAQYLVDASLPGVVAVYVDVDSVGLSLISQDDLVDVDLPNACVVFVQRFDAGVYLDLEAMPA